MSKYTYILCITCNIFPSSSTGGLSVTPRRERVTTFLTQNPQNTSCPDEMDANPPLWDTCVEGAYNSNHSSSFMGFDTGFLEECGVPRSHQLNEADDRDVLHLGTVEYQIETSMSSLSDLYLLQ